MEEIMSKKNVIIIGAAGRDFHNFNTYYRNNDAYNVVAFTQQPRFRTLKAANTRRNCPAGFTRTESRFMPKKICPD